MQKFPAAFNKIDFCLILSPHGGKESSLFVLLKWFPELSLPPLRSLKWRQRVKAHFSALAALVGLVQGMLGRSSGATQSQSSHLTTAVLR